MDIGRFIAFTPKILFAFFVIFQLSNLVICSDEDSDSLENAVDFVERRQRDLELQENDYYGQPEDIGYGYQKNFGFFENGPAKELGSPDSDPETDFRNALYNYHDGNSGDLHKRKTNFRERLTNSDSLMTPSKSRNKENTGSDIHCSYTTMLRDLWCKYRQSRKEEIDLEDLTPDQVVEILDTLKDDDEEGTDSYEGSNVNANAPHEAIPLRSRRNYRVFDRLNEKKRYPYFGEGFYGKRSPHSQRLNYENPSESDFLYALKFINPDANREAVENLKETGYDVLNDEKDGDVIRILNDDDNTPRDRQEETYWTKKVEPEDVEDGFWLPGPVSYPSDDTYLYESDKRTGPEDELWFSPDTISQPSVESYPSDSDKRTGPKIFKQHNGIHLNNKRIPVKRSSIRSKKEATNDEKTTQELKGIFEGKNGTIQPPKKKEEKKLTETPKKTNVTKPEVTKHRDVKKLVRRANDYTKEQIYPLEKSSEIDKIFNVQKVDKKSIDWSQYFGYDKRSQQWLKDDSISRAENLFLTPKSKRYMTHEMGNDENSNLSSKSQNEKPLETKIFNNKNKLSDDMDKNIENIERKLGNIEEKIIDYALKYTGAHIGSPNKISGKVKSEIVHHLEAAYGIEKMKDILEEFKESMEPDDLNEDEEIKKTDEFSNTTEGAIPKKPKPSKRVATREEMEDYYGKENMKLVRWPKTNNNEYFENELYNYEECPLLKKNLDNCYQVQELSGKYTELLLPACSLQQICYICGPEVGFTKPAACDLMYITQSKNLCQGDLECIASARNSMFALRDIHDQEVLMSGGKRSFGSCLYDSCIQKFFLNPLGVVYG